MFNLFRELKILIFKVCILYNKLNRKIKAFGQNLMIGIFGRVNGLFSLSDQIKSQYYDGCLVEILAYSLG